MQETWTIAIVTAHTGNEASQTDRVAGLFDRHQERLYRLARRLSYDAEEAKDLVQDTFLRVARRPGSVPRHAEPEEAWLVRILVNLSRDRHRRAVVGQRARSSLRLGEEADPSHPESALVARLTVRKALTCLPPRRRAIVVLHEMEGMPVSRIAEVMGTARVTVRWHLSQARKELANWLSPAPKPAAKDEGTVAKDEGAVRSDR